MRPKDRESERVRELRHSVSTGNYYATACRLCSQVTASWVGRRAQRGIDSGETLLDIDDALKQLRGRNYGQLRVVRRRHRRGPARSDASGASACRDIQASLSVAVSLIPIARALDSVTSSSLAGWSSPSSCTRSVTASWRTGSVTDTRGAGRLSQPVPHSDPFGSILIPHPRPLTPPPSSVGRSPCPQSLSASQQPGEHDLRCRWRTGNGTSPSPPSPRDARSQSMRRRELRHHRRHSRCVCWATAFGGQPLSSAVFNFLPNPTLDGAALIERVMTAASGSGLVSHSGGRDPGAVVARLSTKRHERLFRPFVAPIPVRLAVSRPGHSCASSAADRPRPLRTRTSRIVRRRATRGARLLVSGSGARIGPSRSRRGRAVRNARGHADPAGKGRANADVGKGRKRLPA